VLTLTEAVAVPLDRVLPDPEDPYARVWLSELLTRAWILEVGAAGGSFTLVAEWSISANRQALRYRLPFDVLDLFKTIMLAGSLH
jgi:hypothetical protein